MTNMAFVWLLSRMDQDMFSEITGATEHLITYVTGVHLCSCGSQMDALTRWLAVRVDRFSSLLAAMFTRQFETSEVDLFAVQFRAECWKADPAVEGTRCNLRKELKC